MTFTIRPARRDSTKLLIGLAGPSGSGKTFSALLIASGIVEITGGRIVGIDTESGRMLQYAPPGEEAFAFDYLELAPPFSPDRYREAFEAAEEHAGAGGVVIVDSTSHEHEGPGGVLEWHDAEVERLANGRAGDKERYNFPAWSRPKAARRKLINRILQSSCHVIFCFRAKEKNALVDKKHGNGKEIVSIGWQPITGDDWPYEMTIFALLNPERKGIPIIDGFPHGKLPLNMRSLMSTEVAITRDTGRRLAKWAGNGAGSATTKPAAPSQRPVRAARGNGGGFTVWLSEEEPAARFERGGDAIDALIEAMRRSATFGDLGTLQANNDAWVRRAPDPLKASVDEAYRQQFREIDRHADAADNPEELAAGGAGPGDPAERTFDDDIAALEPDEWKRLDAAVAGDRSGQLED